MTVLRKTFSATALLALALSATAASGNPAQAESTPAEEEIPQAEVKHIERGDGYVVIYPASDTPPPGEEADRIPTGQVDDDEVVIVANADGSLPLGLEPAELIEAQKVVKENGGDLLGDEETFELLEDHGIEAEEPANDVVTNQTDDAVSSQALTCNGFVAGFNRWGTVTTGSGVFGSPGYRQYYQFSPDFAWTQQLVTGQGIGFEQNTGNMTRTWYGLGSSYTGYTKTANVPWGNVLANPQFRALTGQVGAGGQWCH